MVKFNRFVPPPRNLTPGGISNFNSPVKPMHNQQLETLSSQNWPNTPGPVGNFLRPNQSIGLKQNQLFESKNNFVRPDTSTQMQNHGSVSNFNRPSGPVQNKSLGNIISFNGQNGPLQNKTPGSMNSFNRPNVPIQIKTPPGNMNSFNGPMQSRTGRNINRFSGPNGPMQNRTPGNMNSFNGPNKLMQSNTPGSMNHFEESNLSLQNPTLGMNNCNANTSSGPNFLSQNHPLRFDSPSRSNNLLQNQPKRLDNSIRPNMSLQNQPTSFDSSRVLMQNQVTMNNNFNRPNHLMQGHHSATDGFKKKSEPLQSQLSGEVDNSSRFIRPIKEDFSRSSQSFIRPREQKPSHHSRDMNNSISPRKQGGNPRIEGYSMESTISQSLRSGQVDSSNQSNLAFNGQNLQFSSNQQVSNQSNKMSFSTDENKSLPNEQFDQGFQNFEDKNLSDDHNNQVYNKISKLIASSTHPPRNQQSPPESQRQQRPRLSLSHESHGNRQFNTNTTKRQQSMFPNGKMMPQSKERPEMHNNVGFLQQGASEMFGQQQQQQHQQHQNIFDGFQKNRNHHFQGGEYNFERQQNKNSNDNINETPKGNQMFPRGSRNIVSHEQQRQHNFRNFGNDADLSGQDDHFNEYSRENNIRPSGGQCQNTPKGSLNAGSRSPHMNRERNVAYDDKEIGNPIDTLGLAPHLLSKKSPSAPHSLMSLATRSTEKRGVDQEEISNKGATKQPCANVTRVEDDDDEYYILDDGGNFASTKNMEDQSTSVRQRRRGNLALDRGSQRGDSRGRRESRGRGSDKSRDCDENYSRRRSRFDNDNLGKTSSPGSSSRYSSHDRRSRRDESAFEVGRNRPYVGDDQQQHRRHDSYLEEDNNLKMLSEQIKQIKKLKNTGNG